MFEKYRLRPDNKALLATILALAWPTMLEETMLTAVQYIDTAMVGALGTQATAAVGATSTVGWLIGGTLSAFGVGFLSRIAQACGAGDKKGLGKVSAQAVLTVLVTGMLATLLTQLVAPKVPVWMQVDPAIREISSTYFSIIYLPMLFRTASTIFGTVLRAAGDTKTPMRAGLVSNIVNVVLNFLLIYPTRPMTLLGLRFTMPGAGMGVVGAAAASAIAYVTGGLLLTVALWRHPLVSPRGYSLRPDGAILGPCFRIALPNMLQRFATSLGFVIFSAMINALGDVATAAHTVANTVESAFYIPGWGMQTAAATLIGNAYGAWDREKMHSLTRLFIPIEIGLMLLSGGALFAFAPALVGIFSDSPEVMALGTTVLRMVAVSEPFYGFSIILEGMMIGVGKTKQPFVYNLLGMWCVRIAGTWLCTRRFGLGLEAAWVCMIAHNMLLFVFYLIDYLRGSWDPLRGQPVEKPRNL